MNMLIRTFEERSSSYRKPCNTYCVDLPGTFFDRTTAPWRAPYDFKEIGAGIWPA